MDVCKTSRLCIKTFDYFQNFTYSILAKGAVLVGHCYLNGIGVVKDDHKSFIYHQKCADMGDVYETLMLDNVIDTGLELKRTNARRSNIIKKLPT